MHLTYFANIGHYIPEMILVVLMVGLILLEATYKENEKNKTYFYVTTYIGLATAFAALLVNLGAKPLTIFTGSMTIDPFSTLMKMIMVLGTFGAVYLSKINRDIYETLKSEYVIIAIGVLIGGMILASANNMLMLYIGIETLSILSYVLASLSKNNDRSSEAGLKYALYGGISAGIMLFGMSHIFGMLGTIQFSEMITILPTIEAWKIAVLLPSFLLFFVGIGYKIACVPFHMWSPDVYEGSPLPVTAFFSVVPKIAGVAVLIRVTMMFFGHTGPMQIGWVGLLTIISALTMTVGNVTAINQKSVKRMLAYSSISHAGVMMAGLTVLTEVGIRSIVFYGISYLFMTMVAFYILGVVQDKYNNDHFERFSGLIYRYPFMAIMMTIVMFSLTGLPPFAGFVAKFNILYALLEKKYFALAVILAFNSIVSAYYYLKIVRLMVLKKEESSEKIEHFGFLNQMIITVMTVPVIFLGIFWQKIMMLAQGATIFIK